MSPSSNLSPPAMPMSARTASVGRVCNPSGMPASGPKRLSSPWFPWWEAGRSGVVSAICHAVALILLGISTVSPDNKPSAGMVVAQMDAGGGEWETIEEAMTATPVAVELHFASAAAAGDLNRPIVYDLAPAAAGGDALHEFRRGDLLAGLSESDNPNGGQGTSAGGGLAGVAELGETAGDGKADHNGAKSASFFGIEAGGKSFVFVVDLSGSMAGHRFRFAKAELRRSLEKLSADQRYYIVFFNTTAFPMPTNDLLTATQQNRAKTIRWISQMETGGFTNPWPALQIALELEPDAIFFLTDGEFDPLVVERIEPASTSDSTPIHTIAFQSRDGEELLKAISRKTRGTYRFVK